MNLEQVAHFVQNPQELQLQDAEALRSLTAKYPFSSVYPLLYLTALSNGKSPDLDVALQQQAFKLSDRTKLYYLLVDRSSSLQSDGLQSSVIQSPVIQSPVEQSVVEEREAETERNVESVTSVEESLVEQSPIEQSPVVEERETETEREAEAEPETESVEAFAEELILATALDFDQMTEAFTREQDFELGVDQSSVDQSPVDLAGEEQETERKAETERETEAEVEPAEEAEEVPSSEPVEDDRKSFTSWLKSGQQQVVKAVSQEETVPKKLPANDLIDQFIEKEPSISRSKTDFYSPSKKARESLDEDALPVSETLAKIYAAQGNYPKAIHVYHQLMLSVPEKKALFAVQIEELKKKITP